MSFILDALKKSESERQRQASPTLADVARPVARQKTPAWMWVLGALLVFNVAVLLGIYFRPDVAPVTEPPATLTDEQAPVTTPAQQTAPQPVITPRQETRPLSAEADTAIVADADSAADASPPVSVAATQTQADEFDSYPTYATLVANGSLQGTDLHVDIHVYSDVAADRFVFINMNKYREGQQLVDGPRVIAITPDGVILQQDTHRFLLPRE